MMSFQNLWSQSKAPNNYSNDTIVVIITKNNKELRGLLIEENFTTISLEIANEVKTYRKNDLKSYRYITRNQIKSIKEFDNPNPIYADPQKTPTFEYTQEGRFCLGVGIVSDGQGQYVGHKTKGFDYTNKLIIGKGKWEKITKKGDVHE